MQQVGGTIVTHPAQRILGFKSFVALARRLELDLGHQRERKSMAKQPTPLAGEAPRDPRLWM